MFQLVESASPFKPLVSIVNPHLYILAEQAGNRKLLQRLELLSTQINKDHSARFDAARTARINFQRQRTMEAIEQGITPPPLAELPLPDGAPALALPTSGGGGDAAKSEAGGGGGSSSAAVSEARGGGGDRAPEETAAGPTGDSGAAGETAAETAGEGKGECEGEESPVGEGVEAEYVRAAAGLPVGSFRRHCGVCKGAYNQVHHFYHRLCPECAEENYAKRIQTADMRGMVAVVTGGRVRIGYETVLMLLRAGAHVVATTRFPADAAMRFTREPDFAEWRHRLEAGRDTDGRP